VFEYIRSPYFKYKDRINPQIIGGVTPDQTVLDIGCGFEPEVGQASMKNAVGIDINFQHGSIMVQNPILADAQHLPLRARTFDFVSCQALLEHIPKPELCISDIKRVMREDGSGFILIPVDSRQIYQTMKRFIKEFPFSIIQTLKTLRKAWTLWKLPGMLHIRKITLQNISKYLKITKVGKKRHEHLWYAHGPFRILRKLGLVNRVMVDEYAEYYVWVKR